MVAGNVTFEFTANAQIWPRSQNSVLGGEEGKIYLIVADMGSQSGQGLDFISAYRPSVSIVRQSLTMALLSIADGFGWLQRFYSVYDTGNAQVGIATTPFTDATTN